MIIKLLIFLAGLFSGGIGFMLYKRWQVNKPDAPAFGGA